MSAQRQIRGAAAVTQAARTLVSRVLDINTTKNRIHVHDGSTVGGIPQYNCFDAQNQEFTYGAVAGTNSLVMTLAIAPLTYAVGQKFSFKAVNANTGSVTININSLGAVSLRKKDLASLVALGDGDIISGGTYDVVFDGTYFQISISNAIRAEWEKIADDIDISGTDIGSFTGLDLSDFKRVKLVAEIYETSAVDSGLILIQFGKDSYSSNFSIANLSASTSGLYLYCEAVFINPYVSGVAPMVSVTGNYAETDSEVSAASSINAGAVGDTPQINQIELKFGSGGELYERGRLMLLGSRF